jgi:ureidoacrylate peracid hydrolase
VEPVGFAPPSAANACLVVIDMQGDFLDEGAPCLVPAGRSVVAPLQRVLSACREARMPIVHVRTVWQADGVDRSPFVTSERLDREGLRRGQPGAEVIPELAPLHGEYVVDKTRYSGFFQTNLEQLLRSLGVTHVIVGGVATNFCVRATVHDASFRDFFPIVLTDCTASYSEAEHRQSLRDIDAGFGATTHSEQLLETLSPRRDRSAVA